MKKILTQINKLSQFYPYTVAIVGAQAAGRTNFMSCAWHTALSLSPPLFGILVAKKRFTHSVIVEAREFSVNFISAERAKISALLGRRSGRDLDKTSEFGIKLSPAKVISSPILQDAYASFECRLVETRTFGDHDMFVGEVLAVHQEAEAFTERGTLDPGKIFPLLYLGSDFYITTDSGSLKKVLPD